MAVQAILSNFTAFAASAGAGSARVELGLAASFAELLAGELQPPADLPSPQTPMPAATPPPQFYPWVAVPLIVPSAREDRGGKKKRPSPRGDRRPDETPTQADRGRP